MTGSDSADDSADNLKLVRIMHTVLGGGQQSANGVP